MNFKLVILLATFLLIVSAQQCHYSCSTCIDAHYTNCQSCSSSTFKPLSVTSSGATLGICSFPAFTSVNGLGLVILLLSIATGLFLKSQHIFYFIMSIQILGLLSLMEVAYPSSLTTLLDSFQYLMIFSKMQQNSKTSDGVLISRNMYRLQAFLTTADLKVNVTPLFVISFLVALLLALLLLVKKYRDGLKFLSEKRLDTIMTILRTILLLTMQQMLLILYVGIRFGQLGGSEVVMIVLYSAVLVFLLVDINYHRVPYFKAKKMLNLAIAQRFLLPVMTTLPYSDNYHLIIFLNAFGVLQLIFLTRSAAGTKHYVYSALKLAVTALIGVFVAVQLGLNSSGSSRVASIFAVIAIVVFLVAFLAEIVLSIKDQCCAGSKVKNQGDQITRTKSNEHIMLREDTFADDTIKVKEIQETGQGEGHIQQPQSKAKEIQNDKQKERENNLLAQQKKQERKFKAGHK